MLIAYVVASGGIPPPTKGRNTSGGLKEKEGAGINGGAQQKSITMLIAYVVATGGPPLPEKEVRRRQGY